MHTEARLMWSCFFSSSFFLKGCSLHSFTFTDMEQEFFTRTINLWNWILYRPDNIVINARHTQTEMQSERERAGCVAGLSSKGKSTRPRAHSNYYVFFTSTEQQRAKQPPRKLWKKKKIFGIRGIRQKIWKWWLCSLRKQVYISSVL